MIMKISELQKELEKFKDRYGDVEVEYWVSETQDEEAIEADFNKIHDGYTMGGIHKVCTVCEIRLLKC
jgi:hypothetical protein